MKRLFTTLLLAFSLALAAGCGDQESPRTQSGADEPQEKAPQRRFLTIGTGGMTGVYYPTGNAIAKMLNQKESEYGIKCKAESTAGSVFNINAVLKGDMDLGIAQSDRQYQAIHGLAEWQEAGPQADLRAVFSIHPEAVTLVAADDAGIETLADLRGKRVNIGNPGSGQRQNAIDALASVGIDHSKDIQAENVKAAEGPGLLQDDRIDAFFYTVGHPAGNIKEATAGRRKVHFVPIIDVDDLLARYPYYARATIEISNYPQATNKADVPTFGVKATLVASAKADKDAIKAIAREVFENLDEFKKLHTAYSGLTRENMLEGLSAPLHTGAQEYFLEIGLLDLDAEQK